MKVKSFLEYVMNESQDFGAEVIKTRTIKTKPDGSYRKTMWLGDNLRKVITTINKIGLSTKIIYKRNEANPNIWQKEKTLMIQKQPSPSTYFKWEVVKDRIKYTKYFRGNVEEIFTNLTSLD